MITRSCIERIRNSVDIYDVVSQYVVLKKCGANWRGLSPFNQEKTPSFFVMPAKKVFRCFSSGNAGDVFRFIQLVENVSFGEAVEMIAAKFGMPLEFEVTQKKQEDRPYSRKSLFDIHDLVCREFVKNFSSNTKDAKKVREYWVNERKFSLEVANDNCIGFADHDGRALIKKLLDAGFAFDAIKGSGVFFYKDGETDPYRGLMRFRSRLTIPIRDIQGRIIGFSARVVDGVTPEDDSFGAKYVNSSETDIFHKGSILFGLDHARQSIASDGDVWLVEGQFDVFRCWSNGLHNVVAPQGTSVTDVQLGVIGRYTRRLNCMLDGDDAGLKAAERMLPLAIRAGIDVSFYVIPDGHDPDSFFREDFEKKFRIIRNRGVSGIEFLVNRLLNGVEKLTVQSKVAALSKIYDVIAEADSSVAREGYLDELSGYSGLDRHALEQDFSKFISNKKFVDIRPAVQEVGKNRDDSIKIDSAEERLLAVVLSDMKIACAVSNLIDQDFFYKIQTDAGKLLLKILNEVHEGMWIGTSSLDNVDLFSDVEKNLAYTLIADEDDDADKLEIANMCLRKLYCDFIKCELGKINDEMKKISIDDNESMRRLQSFKMDLRGMLKTPPQVLVEK